MKPAPALLAAIAAMLFAGPAAADTTVSAAKLAANPGAYTLDLGNGRMARITRIQAPRDSGKTCNVDMASLQELARRALRNKGDTAAISVPIHMALVNPGKDSPFMTPTCYGMGGGCTIWVATL